jgi:nucleotide-binding universal stress UspA family protein
MAFKDILVHIDGGKNDAARIETAAGVAAAHDAHLIGLFVQRSPMVPEYAWVHLSQDIIDAQTAAMRDAATAAERLFNDIVKQIGVASEWRSPVGEVIEQVTMNGRYADVVVIGQEDPDGPLDTGAGNLTDRLVVSIGRSVLVVPYVGKYPKIGERVLVAWNSSRQASRAVHDALPFLENAKEVHILSVNPTKGETAHGEIPSADISTHLARHGVKARAESINAPDIDVADMLLARLVDEGCDMMVMGAYGHARFRELVLGGVTRQVLDHMTAPVLMSH